jgi:hypothetical protein
MKKLLKMLGLANEVAKAGADADVQWWRVPFGEWPNGEHAQVVDHEGAVEMANELAKLVRSTGKGVPIYIGHPDFPKLAVNFPDKGAKGWIGEIRVEDDALLLGASLINTFRPLIDNEEFAFHSPHFGGRLIRTTPTGKKIYRAVRLRSTGLTNNPNMLECRLPNEAEADDEDDTQPEEGKDNAMLKRLMALFAWPDTVTEDEAITKIGDIITAAKKVRKAIEDRWASESAIQAALPSLANEATDDDALGRLLAVWDAGRTAAQSATVALANEKAAEAGKIVDLTAAIEAASAKATAAETALANERTVRIDLVVADAIRAKRITPAQADAWKARLAKPETFDAELVALSNERSGVNTDARTRDMAGRVGKTVERQQQILSLVNECQEKEHVDYETAWQRVKKTHPDLFKGTEG